MRPWPRWGPVAVAVAVLVLEDAHGRSLVNADLMTLIGILPLPPRRGNPSASPDRTRHSQSPRSEPLATGRGVAPGFHQTDQAPALNGQEAGTRCPYGSSPSPRPGPALAGLTGLLAAAAKYSVTFGLAGGQAIIAREIREQSASLPSPWRAPGRMASQPDTGLSLLKSSSATVGIRNAMAPETALWHRGGHRKESSGQNGGQHLTSHHAQGLSATSIQSWGNISGSC